MQMKLTQPQALLLSGRLAGLYTHIIGLPTSVMSLSHNRERPYRRCMYTGIQTRGDVHSITTPVTQTDPTQTQWTKHNLLWTPNTSTCNMVSSGPPRIRARVSHVHVGLPKMGAQNVNISAFSKEDSKIFATRNISIFKSPRPCREGNIVRSNTPCISLCLYIKGKETFM